LRAEIEFCCGRVETFLGANIAAPLYRLPTIAYLHSFPALLADGVPTEPDTRSLIQFYSEVETLNRGLDLTQAARGDEQTLWAEHGRNREKATRLVQEYCPEARAVVNRHLQ
jgi:hypothetical protein